MYYMKYCDAMYGTTTLATTMMMLARCKVQGARCNISLCIDDMNLTVRKRSMSVGLLCWMYTWVGLISHIQNLYYKCMSFVHTLR